MANTSKSCPSEHVEQREFVSWFRQNYPGVDIFAIPNGGARGKAQAGKLRAEGVTSGVWDLMIPSWFLWIEFKRVHTGNLSKEQKEFGRARLADGYNCMVAYGAEDAKRQIVEGPRKSWGRPK